MRLAHGHRQAIAAGRRPTLSERGAVLVETALAITILVPLAFGALEFGFGWRAVHETVGAARAGVRVAAGLGEDQTADWLTISSIKASLKSAGLDGDLQRVIIYEVPNDLDSTDNGNAPTSCMNATPSGPCNVYSGAQVRTLVSGDFGTNGCTTLASKSLLRGYCPTARDADQRTADYIAVQVLLYTPSVTGMFPGRNVRRMAAMRMEPTATGG